jgi:hypothetical protein
MQNFLISTRLPLEIWLIILEHLNAKDTRNACLATGLSFPFSKTKCFTFDDNLYQKFSNGEFNNSKIYKLRLTSCCILSKHVRNLMTFSHLKVLRLDCVKFTSTPVFRLLATLLELSVLELTSCIFYDRSSANTWSIIFKDLKELRIIRCVDRTLNKDLLRRIVANLDSIKIYESRQPKFFNMPLQLTTNHFVFNNFIKFPENFVSNAREVTVTHGGHRIKNFLTFFPSVESVHVACFNNIAHMDGVKKIYIDSIRSLDDLRISELQTLDSFQAEFIFCGFEYPMVNHYLNVSIRLLNQLEYFLLHTQKKKSQNLSIEINFLFASLPSGNFKGVAPFTNDVFHGIDTLILNSIHPDAITNILEDDNRTQLDLWKLCRKFKFARHLIILLQCCVNSSHIDRNILDLFPYLETVCVKANHKKETIYNF